MKLACIADPHLFYAHTHRFDLDALMKSIVAEKPDALCVLGDIDEVLWQQNGNRREGVVKMIKQLLTTIPNTYYVPGNHDMYCPSKFPPSVALEKAINVLKHYCGIHSVFGNPPGNTLTFLQEKLTQFNFVYGSDVSTLFVGCMGFPCFKHPKMLHGEAYYELRKDLINDCNCINLNKGYTYYEQRQSEAFLEQFKQMLFAGHHPEKIVVLTHYALFEEQSPVIDDVSAYFMNYQLGQDILAFANNMKHIQFLFISGHSHEFSRGQMRQVAENAQAIGLKADYGKVFVRYLEF